MSDEGDKIKWEFYQNNRRYHYWRTINAQGKVVSKSVGGFKIKECCLLSAVQAGYMVKETTQ